MKNEKTITIIDAKLLSTLKEMCAFESDVESFSVTNGTGSISVGGEEYEIGKCAYEVSIRGEKTEIYIETKDVAFKRLFEDNCYVWYMAYTFLGDDYEFKPCSEL